MARSCDTGFVNLFLHNADTTLRSGAGAAAVVGSPIMIPVGVRHRGVYHSLQKGHSVDDCVGRSKLRAVQRLAACRQYKTMLRARRQTGTKRDEGMP